MRRSITIFFIGVLVMALLIGCVAITANSPITSNARSNACAAGDMCGIFMTVTNLGDQADNLVGAKTDVAMGASLHTVVPDPNGGMMMQEIENIPVPAGGAVELKPGSLHIMVMGLKQELKPGDTFPLTLIFENAGERPVQVTVMEKN
jgi:copper(I)-binding protein